MTAATTKSANPSGSEAVGVDKSGDRVKEMFAQIAPRYDLMNHLLSLNIDTYWRSQTVKRLELTGSAPVVDACTGTGDLALAIAKRLDGAAKVYGTDFCDDMLEVARAKQRKKTFERFDIDFIEADTQDLPFDSDFCQAITVAFGLRNVQDTMAGLKEMTRVCKPGGQVAVLEFSKPSVIGLKQLYQFYFKSVLPRLGQSLAKNEQSAYEYLPNSVQQFPCGEDLANMMRSAGLNEVQFWPMTFGVATLYIGKKPASL